jgi:hypothetical protein
LCIASKASAKVSVKCFATKFFGTKFSQRNPVFIRWCILLIIKWNKKGKAKRYFLVKTVNHLRGFFSSSNTGDGFTNTLYRSSVSD